MNYISNTGIFKCFSHIDTSVTIFYHYSMLKKVILSMAIWAVAFTLTVLVYFAMLFVIAISPFDKMRKRAHAQCFWWARSIVSLKPLLERHSERP